MRELQAYEVHGVAGGEVDNWDLMGDLTAYGMNNIGLSSERAGDFAAMLSECASGSITCAMYIIQNAPAFIIDLLKALDDGSRAPIWNQSGMDPHEGGG